MSVFIMLFISVVVAACIPNTSKSIASSVLLTVRNTFVIFLGYWGMVGVSSKMDAIDVVDVPVAAVKQDNGDCLRMTGLRTKADCWAAYHKIDPRLFRALIQQESAWNVSAGSSKGARGLTQVMPFNAKGCGINKADLWEVDANLKCGGQILKSALVFWDKKYPTDKLKAIRHALAEYNAGRTAVIHKDALHKFGETRRYAWNITAALHF